MLERMGLCDNFIKHFNNPVVSSISLRNRVVFLVTKHDAFRTCRQPLRTMATWPEAVAFEGAGSGDQLRVKAIGDFIFHNMQRVMIFRGNFKMWGTLL